MPSRTKLAFLSFFSNSAKPSRETENPMTRNQETASAKTLSFVSRRGFLGQVALAGAGGLASCFPGNGIGAEVVAGQGPWQIGCWTRPWMNHDYHGALDAIGQAGMKHVGLMNTTHPGSKSSGWRPENMIVSYRDPLDRARRVAEEVQQRGLEVAFYYGGLMGAKSRESAVADFRHVIDICATLNCRNVLMGGLAETRGPEYVTWLGAVAECCNYAAETGVQMMIKPHGGLGATGPQLRKAIEAVNHKRFSILYDAGNILYYSDGKVDPVADAATLHGVVTGWCIKDYLPPRGAPATTSRAKGNVDFTPGTGKVDFKAVFAELKKGGFTSGPLMIETLSNGDLPYLLAEAKKAREFVETLVRD
jgi:sugar phosphate isomerase/epimerase